MYKCLFQLDDEPNLYLGNGCFTISIHLKMVVRSSRQTLEASNFSFEHGQKIWNVFFPTEERCFFLTDQKNPLLPMIFRNIWSREKRNTTGLLVRLGLVKSAMFFLYGDCYSAVIGMWIENIFPVMLLMEEILHHLTCTLIIQNLPDRRGLRAPIPQNRIIGEIPDS